MDELDAYKIVITEEYGEHILLTCKNHPTLRWHTKNIDHIGARTIFFEQESGNECDCAIRDLTPV